MGKTQNTIVISLLAVMVLFLVGFGLNAMGIVQLSATGEDTDTGIVDGTSGDSAIVSFLGYDEAGDSGKVQVAGHLYVNRKGENGEFDTVIKPSTAMSSSASTEVSGLLVGEVIQAIAFDSTYYGKLIEFEVANKRPSKSLTEYKIASTGNMAVYFDDEDGTTGTSDTEGNLDLVGSSSGSIDDIKLKNEDDDQAYNVKGLCFDTVTGSNISNIQMNSKWTEANEPKRLKGTCDYFFEIASAEMLPDYETFKTGSLEITADSDDPSENITGYFIDEAYFQSTDLTFKIGYEDDSSSNNDVGAGDKPFTIVIA